MDPAAANRQTTDQRWRNAGAVTTEKCVAQPFRAAKRSYADCSRGPGGMTVVIRFFLTPFPRCGRHGEIFRAARFFPRPTHTNNR